MEGVGREQREMALTERLGGLWLGLVVVGELLCGDMGVECLCLKLWKCEGGEVEVGCRWCGDVGVWW